jgi:hypothetical protein
VGRFSAEVEFFVDDAGGMGGGLDLGEVIICVIAADFLPFAVLVGSFKGGVAFGGGLDFVGVEAGVGGVRETDG